MIILKIIGILIVVWLVFTFGRAYERVNRNKRGNSRRISERTDHKIEVIEKLNTGDELSR